MQPLSLDSGRIMSSTIFLCLFGFILFLAINYILLKKKTNIIKKYSRLRIGLLIYYIIFLIISIVTFQFLIWIACVIGIIGCVLHMALVSSFVIRNKESLMKEIARSRVENEI